MPVMTDSFRKKHTQAMSGTFIGKVEKGQVPATMPHSRTLNLSIMSFQATSFYWSILEKFSKAAINKYCQSY